MTCCKSPEDPIGCCGEGCEHRPDGTVWKPNTVRVTVLGTGYGMVSVPNIRRIEIHEVGFSDLYLWQDGSLHIVAASGESIILEDPDPRYGGRSLRIRGAE